MIRDWFYTIDAYHPDGIPLSPNEMEKRIRRVVRDVETRMRAGEAAVPVGKLSSDERDHWAKVRSCSRIAHTCAQLTPYLSVEPRTPTITISVQSQDLHDHPTISIRPVPRSLHPQPLSIPPTTIHTYLLISNFKPVPTAISTHTSPHRLRLRDRLPLAQHPLLTQCPQPFLRQSLHSHRRV